MCRTNLGRLVTLTNPSCRCCPTPFTVGTTMILCTHYYESEATWWQLARTPRWWYIPGGDFQNKDGTCERSLGEFLFRKRNLELPKPSHPQTAPQMSALLSYIRGFAGPLARARVHFPGADSKFKHTLRPLRRRISVPERVPPALSQGDTSSSTVGRVGTGWLGKIALGTAFGVSSAVLVHAFHTGTMAAMELQVDLNSAEGDWKKIKGENLSS